ncbi:MAG TPA: RluA family pseudouridine synthase [Dehalococcoidia bacterium]|nr:RluA family pseudouridine synthase [Dehalococcoidia bacterium]
MVIPLEPEVRILQVAESTVRLDKYLAKEYPELSRSRLQKLIEQGYILVNGCGAKASQKLNVGDKIYVSLPPSQPVPLIAEPIPLTIIYEDDDLMVVDKPAGLATHPAPGHTSHTLVNAILAHCPDLAKFGDAMRPGIVHRLDKDTSGLMIIAKNNSAQQYLINQFKARLVSKGYLVLVRGKLSPMQGIIEAPVGRDPANRKRMAVVTGGRQARTSYRVKKYLGDYTLLEVTTETGRTHQIRVHLSAIGYPVIGDPVYGVKSAYLKRQFVHAHRLGFCLPAGGEYREFTCELASDLRQALTLICPSQNSI